VEDKTVTIRYRDSMQQERLNIARLKDIIAEKANIAGLLKKL